MTKKLNILSLFNGCGMLRPSLDKAGVKVNQYFSSEIDQYANQIANKNYPDTIQLGDICKWQDWKLPQIDLLTAGFPCQDLSVSGKRKGLSGERSGLLYQALEIRKHLSPRYFLFENVASMSNYWRGQITQLVGVEPIKLNSKYWGAQNRERYFWTNIPNLRDIEVNQTMNDKGGCINDILESPVEYKGQTVKRLAPVGNRYKSNYSTGVIVTPFGKSPCLRKSSDAAYIVDLKTTLDNVNSTKLAKINDKFYLPVEIKKLSPVECERLMNLPDNYTEGVSKTQRYMMLGNGWDIDVLAELLSPLKSDAELFAPCK